MAQMLKKFRLLYGLEFLKGVDILGQKLVAQAFRQVGLGLP